MTTALITGASSGIGAAFARRLAADGHDLVLVARGRDALETLADELRSRGVAVELLVADLADRAQLERVAERARAGGDAAVDLLVNNAGFTAGGDLLDNDLADEEAMLEVMCRATLVLSHAAGRAMRERGRGAVLNVGSVAAWTPTGTYAAAKAWILAFTTGLHAELKPYGVKVAVLAPGLTHTEFHARAGLDGGGAPEAVWMSAEDVVEQGLAGLRRGRPVVVAGAANRLAVGLLDVAPGPVVRLLSRVGSGKGRTH